MANAIGMIEYKTVASGMTAADLMVKTAEVEVIEAKTVCPGKYMVLVTGDLSSVKAAVDAACAKFPDTLIDSFVLGNPHESILGAIYGANEISHACRANISRRSHFTCTKCKFHWRAAVRLACFHSLGVNPVCFLKKRVK